MGKLKRRVQRKIEKHTAAGNKRRLRVYQRNLWSITAMLDHNFEIQAVDTVVSKYKRLDLVPTGFSYPEFYRY